ncbi:MAG: cobalamin biosynthesis protein [Gammaproteobacteria bacterium]|nr:cobalamin biosynthesis protein [Gammaproteobacteria bacterium]
MTESLGIWLVREHAEHVGRILQERLGGTVFRPWQNAAPQREQFRALFPQYSKWVLVMTTGIASRFIDGLISDKHSDPAVVVLDEACRYAISLLGGHEAGGNDLAYRVANVVGAVPVVTTATEALKPLVVGIGCRKGATVEQIERAVRQALGTRDISEIREAATITLKADEPGLREFCQQQGIPLRVIATDDVAARAWVTQPSEWVKKNVGVDGVCEPCALIASPRGKLLVAKMALDGVTVAVVEDRA